MFHFATSCISLVVDLVHRHSNQGKDARTNNNIKMKCLVISLLRILIVTMKTL